MIGSETEASVGRDFPVTRSFPSERRSFLVMRSLLPSLVRHARARLIAPSVLSEIKRALGGPTSKIKSPFRPRSQFFSHSHTGLLAWPQAGAAHSISLRPTPIPILSRHLAEEPIFAMSQLLLSPLRGVLAATIAETAHVHRPRAMCCIRPFVGRLRFE